MNGFLFNIFLLSMKTQLLMRRNENSVCLCVFLSIISSNSASVVVHINQSEYFEYKLEAIDLVEVLGDQISEDCSFKLI